MKYSMILGYNISVVVVVVKTYKQSCGKTKQTIRSVGLTALQLGTMMDDVTRVTQL